jgi:hypothetical protein
MVSAFYLFPPHLTALPAIPVYRSRAGLLLLGPFGCWIGGLLVRVRGEFTRSPSCCVAQLSGRNRAAAGTEELDQRKKFGRNRMNAWPFFASPPDS